MYARPTPDPGTSTEISAGMYARPTPDPAGRLPPAHLASKFRTNIGIAHPGIAPLAPGLEKPQAPPAALGPIVPPGPPFQAAPPGPIPSLSQAPTLVSSESNGVQARGLRVAAIILAVLAFAVLVVLIVLAIAVVRRGPLQATIALNEQGQELLSLNCGSCADGTVVSLGATDATFKNGAAEVGVSQELVVGDNALTVTLRHPDGRNEDIDLVVPVSYRLRTDLAGLKNEHPRIWVNVSAVPDASVLVDGKPVLIAPNGSGRAQVDVEGSLMGGSPTVQILDRKIPYTVTTRHGETAAGELAVRIPVTPLLVEAPGESIVLDQPNFWLAGVTVQGAAVSVAGRPIVIKEDGRFEQLMNVSSEGETSIYIRAEAPQHAPRLVPLRVRRVKDLRAEGKRLESGALRSYTDVLTQVATKASPAVALAGTLQEVRTSHRGTIAVLDVASGCARAPCIARLAYGAKLNAAPGDEVTAFGRLAGAIDWKGQQVPDVHADFVVVGTP